MFTLCMENKDCGGCEINYKSKYLNSEWLTLNSMFSTQWGETNLTKPNLT